MSRTVLTTPGIPAGNYGADNADGNLILRAHDMLVDPYTGKRCAGCAACPVRRRRRTDSYLAVV